MTSIFGCRQPFSKKANKCVKFSKIGSRLGSNADYHKGGVFVPVDLILILFLFELNFIPVQFLSEAVSLFHIESLIVHYHLSKVPDQPLSLVCPTTDCPSLPIYQPPRA